MTVAELIKQLQKIDQNLPVKTPCDEDIIGVNVKNREAIIMDEWEENQTDPWKGEDVDYIDQFGIRREKP